MSSISDYLLERTSKARPRRALLVLEDGTVFAGTAAGASGEVFGEICFNTSLGGIWKSSPTPPMRARSWC